MHPGGQPLGPAASRLLVGWRQRPGAQEGQVPTTRLLVEDAGPQTWIPRVYLRVLGTAPRSWDRSSWVGGFSLPMWVEVRKAAEASQSLRPLQVSNGPSLTPALPKPVPLSLPLPHTHAHLVGPLAFGPWQRWESAWLPTGWAAAGAASSQVQHGAAAPLCGSLSGRPLQALRLGPPCPRLKESSWELPGNCQENIRKYC